MFLAPAVDVGEDEESPESPEDADGDGLAP